MDVNALMKEIHKVNPLTLAHWMSHVDEQLGSDKLIRMYKHKMLITYQGYIAESKFMYLTGATLSSTEDDHAGIDMGLGDVAIQIKPNSTFVYSKKAKAIAISRLSRHEHAAIYTYRETKKGIRFKKSWSRGSGDDLDNSMR